MTLLRFLPILITLSVMSSVRMLPSGTAINVSAIGITIPFSDNTLEGIAELPFETPSCDVSSPCIDTALAEIDTAEFPFPFGNISTSQLAFRVRAKQTSPYLV